MLALAYVMAGVSHPILFGFATGLLATVPFGAPVVYVVACLTLIAQSSVSAGVILFLFASAVVFLWILLGIFGGLETFGLIGLFLGPAIMAAVMAIWREGSDPAKPHPAV